MSLLSNTEATEAKSKQEFSFFPFLIIFIIIAALGGQGSLKEHT